MRFNALQLFTYASLSVSSLIMPLVARDLGADTTFIGLVGAAYGVSSFIANGVFGRAGDRIDRRFLLLAGFLASAVAAALQMLAPNPTTFLIARFLFGFTIGSIPPTLAAYVYDVSRPLGKFTSYNAFGWMLASTLIVGIGYVATHQFQVSPVRWVADRVNAFGIYETLFTLSAAFCLIGFLLSLGLKPMRLDLQVPRIPLALIRKNVHVYASIFFRHFGAAGIWVIYPLYILELGGDLALVGWVHIVNMVSQVLIYRNVERLRRIGTAPSLIGIGLLLSAITFYSFTLVDTAWQLLPLQVPLGISFACLWLGSMKEVMERNVERATATGLLNASMNLSNVAGPILGGLIASAYGFRATMYWASVLTLVAFGLFLRLRGGEPSPDPRPELGGGPASDVGA